MMPPQQRNMLGDDPTQSQEILFSLTPSGGGGGPASRTGAGPSRGASATSCTPSVYSSPSATGYDALVLDERARHTQQQRQQQQQQHRSTVQLHEAQSTCTPS